MSKLFLRGFSEADARYTASYLKFKGDFREFVMGLNVEFEHEDVAKLVKDNPLGYKGGDPALFVFGKIVLSHLREDPKYYSHGVQKNFFSKTEVGLEE